MDDLMSAVERVPNDAFDRPSLAFLVFGFSFFFAWVVWLAPVGKS
jgi:hypothetical protein